MLNRAIHWPVNKVADLLHWAGFWLDNFCFWLDHRYTAKQAKRAGKHRVRTLAEDNEPVSEPYDADPDWLPATPEVKNTPCPVCGSDEFPLVVYDNQLMCPVCQDEAVITDKTFGHTGPIEPIPGWPHLVR